METWDERYDRTRHARLADRDQGVAVIREKLERLGPELDAVEPDAARRRLALILQAAAIEVGPEALAVVAADYVIRDRGR